MGELTYPENWKEVIEKIDNKEITVKEGIDELGISSSKYYKLRKQDSESSSDTSVEKVSGEVEGSEDSEEENLMELTPYEYFQRLKDSVNKVESSDLVASFNSALKIYEGYKETGQEKAAKKLMFLMETIKKEYELVELGVDKFVYRQDIARYINLIDKKVVKIIELENYERPIPEEIQEVIKMTDGIFSDRIIVFTDYTGKVERQIQKERRDKDPILFGVFRDGRNHPLSDRCYFLGDWEDDMCDLTLESMVSEFHKKTGETITHDVSTPVTMKELESKLDKLNSKEDDANQIKMKKINDHDAIAGPQINPDAVGGDNREYRERNIGEKIENIFKKVSSILGKKKK